VLGSAVFPTETEYLGIDAGVIWDEYGNEVIVGRHEGYLEALLRDVMLQPLKRWLEIIIAKAAILEWIADKVTAGCGFDTAYAVAALDNKKGPDVCQGLTFS